MNQIVDMKLDYLINKKISSVQRKLFQIIKKNKLLKENEVDFIENCWT